MKLLICGGGTAGHINPGVAIAEELLREHPTSKVLFIGRKDGKENEIINKAGFDYKSIEIFGLKRTLSIKNIKAIYLAIKSKGEARKIIEEFKPDVILGTGGYVCWPVISVAKGLGIKTVIHESNLSIGLSTRLLLGKIDLMLLNHEETKGQLKGKTKYKIIGNPLRNDFEKMTRSIARKKLGLMEEDFYILSFGGSIGAKKMNEVILEVMKEYSGKDKRIKHLHASGKRYYEEIKDSLARKSDNCKVVPFIDDMATHMFASDLIISRCGAMTLSEICATGVSPILIPSPNVTDNHQYKNAKLLENDGAAIIIEEQYLTKESLIQAVKKLKFDKNGRKNRAKILKAHYVPDSAKLAVKELFLLKNTH